MDVSGLSARRLWWAVGLGLVLVLALALRLKGIHDPLLDHPGWRQGDTAAIARNFATLDLNPLHPQVDYDGPPPNYVELELQIVPFLAALLYKIFGIHEIFGRLISIAFSLGTVAVLAYFGRWLFQSAVAGIAAAALFALYPGSVYYGRTFMPDTTMVFFMTAALYASARWIIDDDARFSPRMWVAAALCSAAFLAKPVALVALVPICALFAAGGRWRMALRAPAIYVFFGVALVPDLAYDRYVASLAEWHWASGITRLHVVPDLLRSLRSAAAAGAKLGRLRDVLLMLWHTMLGPAGALAFVIAIVTPLRPRAYVLLAGWLAAALAYAYVVVTVERVDYYLYLILPLAALWTGGLVARIAALAATPPQRAAAGAAAVLAVAAFWFSEHAAVRPYYTYNKVAYQRAKMLDAQLDKDTLVVMGHYDPSVLYYVNRKGWEEDPYDWTPFDEQSAIRKGARYFIAVEKRRLERNVELFAWLQRFPPIERNAAWPVYVTDYALVLPGAEERWRAFRTHEKHAGDSGQR